MLRFTEMPNGCIVPNSHAPNRDGYHRLSIGNPHNRRTYMLHRAVYEAHNGKLQEGYEVDHLCKCRQCCNPEHLQSVNRTEHLVRTNKERYHEDKMSAKVIWERSERSISGTDLAEMFGKSFSIGCRWIREWKKETH